MPDGCFALQLIGYKPNAGQLAFSLFLEMAALLSLPIIAVIVPHLISGAWSPPGELTTVGLLKISSIVTLGFHAAASAREQTLDVFRWTAGWMVIVAVIITAYLIFRGLPYQSGEFIYSWAHYSRTLEAVSFLSFSYMFVFLFQNWWILGHNTQNIGLRLFIQGFQFGVNIPSILAFCLIICMYEFDLVERTDLFLSGATALLVFASSAATICIEHYVQVFYRAGVASCALGAQGLAGREPGIGG
jgi:hypothetical protein